MQDEQKEVFDIETDLETVEIDLDYVTKALENIDDDDEAIEVIKKHIPKFSNAQVRRYMKLMNRHKPGKEKEKATKKANNRAKNKAAKKARRNNR